jgi:hypothetical protein
MAYRFFHIGRQRDARGEMSVANEVAYASLTLRRLSCIVATAILLLAADLHAQTSTVVGTITYNNHKPAVNVLVMIGSRYRYTDVGGRYKIEGVPQGHQHMTIRQGQRVLWQGDVNISGTMSTVNQVLP